MLFVLLIARIISRILNLLGHGATTLPGRIALYFKYDILTRLSAGVRVICVTGTNGKTTTCALIEQGMQSSGVSYFINRGGANMISGVCTAFINNSTLLGKSKCEYAILECDENSLPLISRYIDAEIIVVTNIFRDQLDRYGEVSTTLAKIREGIDNFDSALLVLNADCPLTFSLSRLCNNHFATFGIDYASDSSIPSDCPYCPVCNSVLSYNSVAFSQLGDFYCSSCGYRHSTPDILAEGLKERSFMLDGRRISIGLGGVYNVYNYLAAVCVLRLLDISDEALSEFGGAFGRMEKFEYDGKGITLLLVKNPVGLANCINYASGLGKKLNVVIALNDKEADGRDISWIWDVDFSGLCSFSHSIYTIGTRSLDMALRLKYTNLSVNAIDGEDYEGLIEIIKGFSRDTVIFSTYTSMMSMRHSLVAEFGGNEFWQ